MPTFTGTTGADEIIGSEESDVIDGRNGPDRIYGRGGDDLISGVVGSVEVYGGTGDDTIIVGSFYGQSIGLLDGGDGYDSLVLLVSGAGGPVESQAQVFISSAPNLPNTLRVIDYSGGANGIQNAVGFERIVGGDVSTNWDLSATTTDWTLVGGSHIDFFTLGSGAATVNAGGGDDHITVVSGSQLFGEDGDDVFVLNSTVADKPTIVDGGAGRDTVSYNFSIPYGGSERSFSLGDGTRDGITYRSIENLSLSFGGASSTDYVVLNITGTDADNIITITSGSRGSSRGDIYAGGGNDIVRSSGSDNIYGGDGNDTLSGGARMYGEAGDDVLTGGAFLSGGDGNDTLSGLIAEGGRLEGGTGTDTLSVLYSDQSGLDAGSLVISLPDGTTSRTVGGSTVHGFVSGIERLITADSADTITLSDGNEYVQAGGGADVVRAGGGDDIIYGDNLTAGTSDGADQLFGDDGNDLIFGGGGADFLSGGSGDDVLDGGTGSNVFDGGAGSDLVVYGIARSSATITYDGADIRIEGLTGTIDTLRGVESLRFTDGVYDVVDGRVAAQARGPITGTAGNDALTGTAGADILSGGGGNDVLHGGGGSDLIDGGAGIDTTRYGGVRASYSTTTASLVVGGAEGGVDQLTGIEVLQFLDGRVSYDVSDISTVVYRLYDAAFDRAPDAFGLADYSRALSSGQLTVQQVLDIFAGSGEFQDRYGALNNEQFVREMYRFSLNREGDANGVAGYVTALNNGQLSRAEVLGIFSESPEHQQLINTVITSQGLFVQDEATIAIARLYDSVFNRVPDLRGLQDYRGYVDQGFGLEVFAKSMVDSPEFQTRFGSLTNQQFVEQIYRFVLDREGDAGGISGYVQALNDGLSRASLVLIFSESPEHRISYQATFDAQVRNLGVAGFDPERAALFDQHEDAFVLPAYLHLGVQQTAHADDWASPPTTIFDHGTPDHTPNAPSPLIDDMIPISDLPLGHHHSDWI